MGRREKEKNSFQYEINFPLLKAFRENQKRQHEQKALRAEYDIKDEDFIVVEKKNAVAQILKTIFHALFITLNILINVLLIVLATIGLASLIYPNIRAEVLSAAKDIYVEIKGYLSIR